MTSLQNSDPTSHIVGKMASALALATPTDFPRVTDHVKPTGDLMLKVGEGSEAKIILVSSTSMAAGSPVFRALLSGKFMKERNKIAGRHPVLLPGDDPAAMLLLCRVLHFQSKAVKIETYKILTDLASVVNKYLCAEAFLPWSQVWIRRYFAGMADHKKKWTSAQEGSELELLALAFAFDDHEFFHVASQRAVYYCSNKQIIKCEEDMPNPLFELLPLGLLREYSSLTFHRPHLLPSTLRSLQQLPD